MMLTSNPVIKRNSSTNSTQLYNLKQKLLQNANQHYQAHYSHDFTPSNSIISSKLINHYTRFKNEQLSQLPPQV